MKSASRSRKLIPPIILGLAVSVVLSLAPQAGAAKQEKKEGFLGYLFELLSADEVPVAPTLTAADLEAIDKLETLLAAQNDRSASGGNFVLLGALAAAKNDIGGASSYLNQACKQMPDSPLPATMAGQVYVQAGDFQRAKALHCQAIRKVGNPCRSPALAANSSMDLAVAYAKSGDLVAACLQLKKAESLLLNASRDPTQAALGWLQMGIVYADSIGDKKIALCAWINGSAELSGAILDESAATLKIDLDVRIADTLMADGQLEKAADYLHRASGAVAQLSENKKPEAQFQIGSSYVELSELIPEDNTYADMAAEQLAALTDQDAAAPGTLGAYRDAALAHAKLIKASDPDQANELLAQALKWTLQIGQSDSAYGSVFDAESVSLLPNGVLEYELLMDGDQQPQS